jgi:hypothetical protein
MRDEFFSDQRCGGEVPGAVEDKGCIVDCTVYAGGDLFDEELTCFFFEGHAGEEVIQAILDTELRIEVGKDCRV